MNTRLVDTRFSAEEQSFWLGRILATREIPELRQSVRRLLDVEILVNYDLTYSAHSHARNLSLTGVFVAMEAEYLPPGSCVEVVLRYRYKGRRMEHRLPATVMRVESDGMGLTFGGYNDQIYTDLVNLLYAG